MVYTYQYKGSEAWRLYKGDQYLESFNSEIALISWLLVGAMPVKLEDNL